MAVVCGVAALIAVPSIAYHHGEADATARMGPQARVVYTPPAAAPDAYLCSVSCAPAQAPGLSADEHRARAAYWSGQKVTLPRSSGSGGGSVSVAAPRQAKAPAASKQAKVSQPKAAKAPKQASAPKAPKQSLPSTTTTVTQKTSTTSKGTTTTSTTTKTTIKG